MLNKRKLAFFAGMDFGLTDTIDCTNINKPVEDVIRDMTGGAGVDFSFDCTGNPDIIYSAMDCANPVLKSARGLVELITTAQLSSEVGWFEKWHQRN